MSESVSIFYILDGKEWAEYLQDKFSSKEYDITAVLRDFRETTASTETKLNILLITPGLIELDTFEIKSHFNSASAVAVLAGVDDDDWEVAAKILKLESGLEWFIYELSETEESVRGLLMFIVSLYENIGRKSPRVSWSDRDSISSGTEDDSLKANLEKSISKIGGEVDCKNTEEDDRRVSEASIYCELPTNKPLRTVSFVFRKDDHVYILLEGTNHGRVEVNFQERASVVPASRVSDKATLYSFQHNRTEHESFAVMLDGTEIGYGEVEELTRPNSESYDERFDLVSIRSSSSGVSSRLSDSSTDGIYDRPTPPHHWQRPVDMIYNTVPRTPSGISASSHISSLGQSDFNNDIQDSSRRSGIGTSSKLDQLNRLLQDVTDPVSVICQSLQIENDVGQLDERLASMLQSTDVLKHLSYQKPTGSISDTSDAVWPTLLHFGAQYNLRKLCCLLVNNPMTCVASINKNWNDCFPHDIAKMKGHIQLADYLKRASDEIMSKSPSPQSQSTNVGRTPPPVHPRPRTHSSKSVSGEEEGTPKKMSILKRPSQDSLKSEEEVFDFRKGSTSSMDSLRVTFGVQAVSDDERTPVPSMDDNYDPISNYDESSQGFSYSRESAGLARTDAIAIPKAKSDASIDADMREIRRQDLDDWIQGKNLSSSVPRDNYMDHAKKQPHGLFGRLFQKKDTTKSTFYANENVEDSNAQHGHPHTGEKTKVYKHKKEHHHDRSDSSPEAQEQFRSRLKTYPLPGQIMKRPNVKKLKQKHAADNNLSSSISDLVTTAAEGASSGTSHQLHELPCRAVNNKKVHKRDKKNLDDSKDHHKSRIEWMIRHASKRQSTRLHHAQTDQHTPAPALPPRPTYMKNLGMY